MQAGVSQIIVIRLLPCGDLYTACAGSISDRGEGPIFDLVIGAIILSFRTTLNQRIYLPMPFEFCTYIM